MASPLQMLDMLEDALAAADAQHMRSKDFCLTLRAPTLTVLGCRGFPIEDRKETTGDYVILFTVKQARSMLRTHKRALAAEAV